MWINPFQITWSEMAKFYNYGLFHGHIIWNGLICMQAEEVFCNWMNAKSARNTQDQKKTLTYLIFSHIYSYIFRSKHNDYIFNQSTLTNDYIELIHIY